MSVTTNFISPNSVVEIDLLDKILDINVPDDKHIILLSEDVTRPGFIVPHMVLDHLIECRGWRNVTLVVANGMHRAFSMSELSNKFGPNVSKIRILFNNPQNNNDWLRDFKNKNDAYVISLSTTVPHMHVFMSGGNKLVVPGCAHWTTTRGFHRSDRRKAHLIMEEWSRGIIDYYVCMVINWQCCCIDLFCGDSHYYLAEFKQNAKKYFEVCIPRELPDAVILEPTIKTFDFQQSMNAFNMLRVEESSKQLVRSGGIIGILANPVDGMGVHYLFQATNGISPVFYDELYARELKDRHLVIISENLAENVIQDFFKTKIMVFKTEDKFKAFLETKFDNPTINHYIGCDVAIGV